MFKITQSFNTIFRSKSPSNGAVLNDEWVDDEITLARARLAEKREAAIAQLGEKWILHKVHSVHNLNKGVNTLGKKTA
jgi:hypothetical protein